MRAHFLRHENGLRAIPFEPSWKCSAQSSLVSAKALIRRRFEFETTARDGRLIS